MLQFTSLSGGFHLGAGLGDHRQVLPGPLLDQIVAVLPE